MKKVATGALGIALAVSGCSSTSSHARVSTTSEPRATLTSVTKAPAVCSASALVGHMNLGQQVGQLFMVGTPTASSSQALISEIAVYHVGGAFLFGHSSAALATIATQTGRIQQAASVSATRGARLLISTDQEGGLVQVLHGSGFAPIPNALSQARQSPTSLQTQAKSWGTALKRAGITMNLAPVADDVLPQNMRTNAPIGQLNREYGSNASTTSTYATAFARGMAAAGVLPTAKHFPGLGNVRGNTDFSANVHDTTTTASDPNLGSYVQAANAGHGFVMMASAFYDRIDRTSPAVFSPKVVNLLRAKGFHGPIITDDFTSARAVTVYTPTDRAVRAISAGVDVILLQNGSTLPTMYNAILTKAEHDPTFAAKVKAAVLSVLTAKQANHLLPSTCS